VNTWTYHGQVPGPEIRVRKGDVVQAMLGNQLPAQTTVHWHGIAIRNNMDGVPMMTQAPVPAGGAFTYQFTASDPGTYWYHPMRESSSTGVVRAADRGGPGRARFL
jgi:FtsP/CotA-like multicopper oxidase with cupredoxin domain